MSQHDMVIDNGPGLAVRTDMQAALQALASASAGPVEPTTKYAGQIWLDTSVVPNGALKMRNQANSGWVSLPLGGIGFAPVDIGFTAKSSPDRFVWNDKADLSGTDVATLADTGEMSVKADFTIQQPAGGSTTSRMVVKDSAGVSRGYLSTDLSGNSIVLAVANASAVTQQSLSISNSGLQIFSGAAAGTVFTTGNIAYTGGDANNITFPVGTCLLAWHTVELQRNAAVVPRLGLTTNDVVFTGAGAIIAGSWSMRGTKLTVASVSIQLIQRTA